jgi:hypothetical protein
MRTLLLVFLAGCSQGFDLGGGKADAGAASDAGAADAKVVEKVTGAGCGQVAPGVVLCRAISLCPQLVVDSDVHPNCGFRIRGETIDLECWCDESSLCPMGAPTTCEAAARLLDAQTELGVCLQVHEGRCAGTR